MWYEFWVAVGITLAMLVACLLLTYGVVWLCTVVPWPAGMTL